jgi:entericidin A
VDIKNRKVKMKTLKKLVACLVLLTFTAGVVTGCNTARGFGEDMESAGESIQDGTN